MGEALGVGATMGGEASATDDTDGVMLAPLVDVVDVDGKVGRSGI
jgi:hypothetical protein